MKSLSKKLVYLVGAAAFMTGCAGIQTKEPSVIQLNLGGSKTLSYQKINADGEKVAESFIESALNQHVLSATGYKKKFQTSTSVAGIYDVQGVEVNRGDSEIFLSYVNGDHSYNTNTTNVTKSTARFTYIIEDTPSLYVVRLSPPAFITTTTGYNLGVIPFKQMLTDEQLVNSVTKVFRDVAPNLSHRKKISGEFNVSYNDESVFANFSRLMGKYKHSSSEVKKFDIDKDSVFAMSLGDETLPLKISVYPYRNGSKVVYEFNVPYVLTADGGTTYDQSVVNQAIDRIEQVARD